MSKSPKAGISARIARPDLSDFSAILDDIETLGVESIELPAYDMDLVVGGRIYKPQLAVVKAAIAGRKVGWTVHGPLSINFMDEAFRGPRHFEVLTASVEAAAALVNTLDPLNTLIHASEADASEKPTDEKDQTQAFIIGGAEIYAAAQAHCTRMIVTEISKRFNCDAFFPVRDPQQWQEISRISHHSIANDVDYAFVVYERR